jgi:TonB family protein
MTSVRIVGIALALCSNLGVMGAQQQQGPARPQGEGTQVAPAASEAPYTEDARLIQRVDPVYPAQAKRTFVTGAVVLTATIAKDGSLADLKVVKGNAALSPSATSAASKWKFEPYRVDGIATAVDITISEDFEIGSSGAQATSEWSLLKPTAAPPARTLPAPPAGLMRISGRVMAGMLDKRVEPVYPADSIALDARGAVVLLATIRKTGEVSGIEVVSGPQRFRDAAATAVKQWTYHPYLIDGNAVDVQTPVVLEFAPPK